MGGEIAVESAPGEGSTFEFTAAFPLPTRATVPNRSARLANVRVLIVDDNAVNRGILEGQLLRWGMQPASVDGGEAAIRGAHRRARRAAHRSSWCCSTRRCPTWTASTWPREWPREPALAGTTIMMLTSGGRYGDSTRCRELGIAAYLTKPVKQADLFDGDLPCTRRRDDGPPRVVAAPIPATDAVRRARDPARRGQRRQSAGRGRPARAARTHA